MRHWMMMAATATMLALPAVAQADEFVVLIYESPADLALRTDTGPRGQAYWADYTQYGEALAKAGAIRSGAALAMPETAVSFDRTGRYGGVKSADQLRLGGYFRIEAASADAAEALVRIAPASRRGGRAELRPLYPAPTMAAK